MKKVAIFGKPGSGKSTLSKKLSQSTEITLYSMDSIEFKPSGERVASQDYEIAHAKILHSDSWIMDGFGPIGEFNKRLEIADTLIYIDLPYVVSYWLVTKRLIKGLFIKPEGWPEGCSVLKGSLQSYKVLKMCPKFWNEKFTQKLANDFPHKTVHVIRSVKGLNHFLLEISN